MAQDDRVGDARRVRTRFQQALDYAPPGVPVVYAHREVQGGRLLEAVDRVDVAFVVREDVLEHGQGDVRRAEADRGQMIP